MEYRKHRLGYDDLSILSVIALMWSALHLTTSARSIER